MKKFSVRSLAVLAAVLASTGGYPHSLHKHVAASGLTAAANSRTSVRGTFGQSVIGGVAGAGSRASQGFWWGDPAGSQSRVASTTPASLTLLSNSPNPFRTSTVIRFSLASQKDVELKLYAENGALVSTTHLLQCPAGPNEHPFLAGSLPSGAYNYTLSTGQTVLTGIMTIQR